MDQVLSKGLLFGAFIVLVVLGGLFFFFFNSESAASSGNGRVCFENGACIDAEVADSEQERSTGLMNRTSLASDSGMLFVLEQSGRYPFWMKNTKIPLDIVWVNSDNYVVEISENASPCTSNPCPMYGGTRDALYVIETNAGFVQENSLRLNQKVEISR